MFWVPSTRNPFKSVWSKNGYRPCKKKLYLEPKGDPKTWTFDERLYYEIHHPQHPWQEVYKALEPYPSHLHIDLLPRAQGQGNGRRMMNTLLNALKEHGSSAVHLGMHPDNARALNFYKNMGFFLIEADELPKDTSFLAKYL
jgi:ribosomal protein S18 acetylase RimI-like enzyme